jgi:hypothetical protein
VRPPVPPAYGMWFRPSRDSSQPADHSATPVPRTIHVYVNADRELAKFWLAAVRMAYNYGFSESELNRIADIARKHEAEVSKAWHDYFKRSDCNGGGGSERSRN